MFFNSRQVVCLGELRQAVTKVADTRENEFLTKSIPSQRLLLAAKSWAPTYLCFGDIFGGLDPFNVVSKLLNGIHQAPDVAGNIVEEVDGGHVGPGCGELRQWRGRGTEGERRPGGNGAVRVLKKGNKK